MRRAVDAERAAAHIGAVEIEFQNFILGEPGLEPDRQKRFLHLALDGALVVQEQVLRQLLGDRRTALPHAAGLRVGHQRARGAGDVDAEMVVEAAVLGGQRRLDQIVRKILQRNRIIVLDAAAADRIAVAVEKRHREIGFLQPVVVGGFAKRRHRQCQHQQQAAEPEGGGFGQRFDEYPALPAADIEAVHEGGDTAHRVRARPCRKRTASSRCAHRDPASSAGSSSSSLVVRSGAPGPQGQFAALEAPGRAPSRRHAGMLRQTQGVFTPKVTRSLSIRAGAINQWSGSRF